MNQVRKETQSNWKDPASSNGLVSNNGKISHSHLFSSLSAKRHIVKYVEAYLSSLQLLSFIMSKHMKGHTTIMYHIFFDYIFFI